MRTAIIIGLWTIVPAVITLVYNYFNRRFPVTPGNSRSRDIIVGAGFGLGGIAANTWGVYLASLDAIVCLRDAFAIVAGLFFGPVAGIVATIIIASERALTPLFGIGAESWGRCSVATLLAGLFAIVIGKYVFADKRPAFLPGMIFAGLAEVLHLAILFLFGTSHVAKSLGIVYAAFLPMCLGAAGAVGWTTLCCRAWGNLRSNFFSVPFGAAMLYALALLGIWGVSISTAHHKTEAVLNISAEVLASTIDEVMDTTLSHVADAIVGQIKTLRPLPAAVIRRIAKDYEIDELNIVNKNGTIISSTDSQCQGAVMPDSPTSAACMVLTDGKTTVFSQKFRNGVHNPDARRKYLGVPFQKGEGFIQIGYDEQRLVGAFSQRFARLLYNWRIGESGYYICVNMNNSRIATAAPAHPDIIGKPFAETGIKVRDIPDDHKGEITFRTMVFDEQCFCRQIIYAKHRLLAVIPVREFYGSAAQYAFTAVVILFGVFAVFGYFIGKIIMANRRVEELRKIEDEHRKNDMAMAKTIQSSTLPLIFPAAKEFTLKASLETAREVGGDFYDFYELPSGKYFFLIADVSGKGIPAAMFMMRAKAIIRSCVFQNGNLAKATHEANLRLADGNDALMFVTAWLGTLDPKTGCVEYVNAGHNSPLIKHATGTAEWVKGQRSLFLAADSEVAYYVQKLILAPNEGLLLYTDGVTEALNSEGKFYGEQRLKDTLEAAPRLSITAIRNDLRDFVNGAEQSDDITMLGVIFHGSQPH